jgi:glutathione S-transferase
MSNLKVLGRITSINVRKVLWTADELGLDYVREDWGLPLRDPNVPEFLALNPNAQVPVILDGDLVLWESSAIMTYLARRAGSPLLPADPAALAIVEQWLYWQAGELVPAWGYAVQKLIRNNPAFDDPARLSESINRWTAKMVILEAQLAKTGAYVTGASPSLADVALGLSVHRWYGAAFDKPDLPAVAAYYDRLRARPAAAPWMGSQTP